MRGFRPVIIDQKIIKDYFVSPDGEIWSAKGGTVKQLLGSVSGTKRYPKVRIIIDGVRGTDNYVRRSVSIHRIVCESFHPFPVPETVKAKVWKTTDESVKNLVKSLYQVNHIDHDHQNYHPSNLEWVTVKQNSKKYQEHRARSK
jgi:hypothetical protein